jgi:hypothetical protein
MLNKIEVLICSQACCGQAPKERRNGDHEGFSRLDRLVHCGNSTSTEQRFVVYSYITEGAPLTNYNKDKSWKAQKANLEMSTFHRSWCISQGKGKATIIPAKHLKLQQDYLWKWRILIGELDQVLLVRDVMLTGEARETLTQIFEHCSGLADPTSSNEGQVKIDDFAKRHGATIRSNLFSVFVVQALG